MFVKLTRYFGAFRGGALFFFFCFSPELGRRGVYVCSLKEALFSAEEMES